MSDTTTPTTARALRYTAEDLEAATWVQSSLNLMGVEFDSVEDAIDTEAFPYGYDYEEMVEEEGELYSVLRRYSPQELAAGRAASRARWARGTALLEQARVITSSVRVGLVSDAQYEEMGRVDSPIQVRQAGWTAQSPRYYLIALRARD